MSDLNAQITENKIDAQLIENKIEAQAIENKIELNVEEQIIEAEIIKNEIVAEFNALQGLSGPNLITGDTSTTLTGILKGNGTDVDVAIPDVDYLTPQTAEDTYVNETGDTMTGDLTFSEADIVNVDRIGLNTSYTPNGEVVGSFYWNDQEGTADLKLKGGNVTLQLGQETVKRVVNKTGGNLLESQYKVVRIRKVSEGGAQGQRLAVVLAQADNEMDSTDVLGLVTENIASNQEGFITTEGEVKGINTTGSLQGETWVDGDMLFLSPTVAGGITKVKPEAPNHLVIVGYVEYAHQNQGKIYVKVDTGYEIDELHNVKITNPQNGEAIVYNDTLDIWENKKVDIESAIIESKRYSLFLS